MGLNNLVGVIEFYAGQKLLNHFLGNRMLCSDSIDFGHFFLRMSQAMIELAVICQKEKSRCVFIQAPDRLHASDAQRRRK